MGNRLKVMLVGLLGLFIVTSAYGQAIEPKKDEKKPKWGYVDKSTGKWAIKPTFDKAGALTAGPDGKLRGEVEKNGLIGFVGENGKVLGAGVVFEKVEKLMSGDNRLVTVRGKQGVITLDGVYTVKPEITSLKAVGHEGYIFGIKEKTGFMTADGTVTVAADYSNIDTSVAGFFVVTKGDKAGILTREGELVLEPKDYTAVKPATGNYWRVFKKEQVGFFNVKDKALMLEAKYLDAQDPIEVDGKVYFAVRKGKKWGIVDRYNSTALKFAEQSLRTEPWLRGVWVDGNRKGNGLWVASTGNLLPVRIWRESAEGPFKKIVGEGSWALYEHIYKCVNNVNHYGAAGSMRPSDFRFTLLIDGTGTALPTMEPQILATKNAYLIKNKPTDGWAVYDMNGMMVRETGFTDDKVVEKDGWLFGYKKSLSPDFEEYDALQASKDLTFVKKANDKKWTRLTGGKLAATETYDEVAPEEDGGVPVCKSGLWGLYRGKTLALECKYTTPVRASGIDGHYVYGNPGRLGLITGSGHEVLAAEYDSIAQSVRPAHLVAYKGGNVGLYNMKSAEWVIPHDRGYTRYSFIDSDTPAESGMWVYRGEMGGVTDASGNEIVPVKYDSITKYGSRGFYSCETGGTTEYYTLDGARYQPVARGYLSDEAREGDRNYNGNKGEMQWVDVNCDFMEGHTIKLVGTMYNSNGKAHVGRGGDVMKVEYVWFIDSDKKFFFIDDQMFFVPYAWVTQPRYTERKYWIKYTLYDITGGKSKVLDTCKINFGMIRN